MPRERRRFARRREQFLCGGLHRGRVRDELGRRSVLDPRERLTSLLARHGLLRCPTSPIRRLESWDSICEHRGLSSLYIPNCKIDPSAQEAIFPHVACGRSRRGHIAIGSRSVRDVVAAMRPGDGAPRSSLAAQRVDGGRRREIESLLLPIYLDTKKCFSRNRQFFDSRSNSSRRDVGKRPKKQACSSRIGLFEGVDAARVALKAGPRGADAAGAPPELRSREHTDERG